MNARYVRLAADAEGESHFEDLEVVLERQDFAPPAAPLDIAQFLPADGTLWVGAEPDWAGDAAHPSPRRQLFCIVQGSCDVTASDGDVRSFGRGSVLLLEDTTGRGHSTSVTGNEELLVFAVTLA